MHSAMQKPLASYKKDTFEAFCMGKVAKCENWGLQIDEIVYGIATQSLQYRLKACMVWPFSVSELIQLEAHQEWTLAAPLLQQSEMIM